MAASPCILAFVFVRADQVVACKWVWKGRRKGRQSLECGLSARSRGRRSTNFSSLPRLRKPPGVREPGTHGNFDGCALIRERGDLGRPCTGVNDRTHVLATQRRGEPAWHKRVYNLHALDVARSRHDLEKRTVKRQRALELCNIGDGRLAQKTRLLSPGPLGSVVGMLSTSSTS